MKALPCLFLTALASAQVPVDPSWDGAWTFTESWKTRGRMGAVLTYGVDISREGRQVEADIDVDGYQTCQRLLAKVEGTPSGIRLSFLRTREEHMGFAPYDPGDLLLELKREGGQVKTLWGKLKPALESHQAPGPWFRRPPKAKASRGR